LLSLKLEQFIISNFIFTLPWYRTFVVKVMSERPGVLASEYRVLGEGAILTS
jgi:hypothetical protein